MYIYVYSDLRLIHQLEISKSKKSKLNFLLLICNFELEIKDIIT